MNGSKTNSGNPSGTGGALDQTSLQLLQLSGLIQTSVANYVAAKNGAGAANHGGSLPPKPLFDAQRTLLAAAGMLTELVSDPSTRIIEVATQQFEARSLHLAAATRVPDALAERGELSIDELSARVGVDKKKLSRVMRCLCSIHIFEEPREDVFANNRITAALVGNDPLRAYVLLCGQEVYTASDYLPRTLRDPVKGPSYAVEVTAFQDAVGTEAPRWIWLEEQVRIRDLLDGRNGPNGQPSAYPGNFGTEMQILAQKVASGQDDQARVARPEHGLFGLAMVGGGRVFGEAHLYDFPWASLGAATVVDVGGGVGGFCLQLSHIYPDLKFVIQDRAPVLKQGETEIWPRENAAALHQDRVQFVQHDFFQPNPVKNADVYWLRYIMHDWSDDYCVQILKGIKAAMGPRSRLLICDQVMNTTSGCPELPSAPAPLPANYGYFTRYSHTRDLSVMAVINGIERKPTEFRELVERAGLHLNKFWECRSQVGLVEVVLRDSDLKQS